MLGRQWRRLPDQAAARSSAPTATREPRGRARPTRTSPTATAARAAEVDALIAARPAPRRAARRRAAVPAGRGRVRGAPRDGHDARRRAVPPHPRPPVRPRRAGRGRRGGRRAAGRRARLGRRREPTGRSPTYRGLVRRRARRRPTAERRPASGSERDRSRPRRSSSTGTRPTRCRPRRRRPPTDAVLGTRCGDSLRAIDRRRPTAAPRPAATGGRWRCTGRSAGQVPRRAARRVPARRRPTRSPRCCRVLQRRAACRSPPPAGAAACAAHRCPCTAASCSTSRRWHGIVASTTISGVVDVLAGHVRARPRGRAAADHGLTVGHWPQSFDIATVGGWLACRGAGQYSTRYGKIEDMVVGLEVVLADGTVVTHRRHARPRRSGPTSTSCSSAPRARSASSPAPGCAPIPSRPPSAAAAYGFASFDDGLDACRRILRRGATPAVLRLYDAAESQRGHGRRRHAVRAARARRGRPGVVDADDGDRRRGRVRRRATLGRRRWSSSGSTTATTSPRSQALTRKGFVVDTMEIAGAVVAAARRSSTRRRAALLGGRRTLAATCHQSPQLPRRRVPLLHVRGHAAAPTRASATYVALWDAGTAGRARPAAAPLPPPRRRAQPRPLRARGARRRLGRARRRSRRRSTRTASSTPASSACRRRSASRPMAVTVTDGRSTGPRSRAGAQRRRRLRGPVRRSPARVVAESDEQRAARAVRAHASLALRRVRARRRRCRRGASSGALPLIARRSSPPAGTFVRRPGGVHRHPACSAACDVHWFGDRLQRSPLTARVAGAASAGRRCGDAPPRSAQRAPVSRRHPMSILVIDVGTSGLRAAIVRPDATVDARRPPAVRPRHAVAGLVEFDAAAMAAAVLDVARAALADARARRRGRHHQPAGVDDRVGPRHRRAGRARRSAGRTCARSSSASWPRPSTASASPRTSRPPRSAWLLDDLDPDRTATCCFGTVDTWIAWTLSERRAARHRPHQRRRHRPAARRRAGWSTTRVLDALRIPACDAARRIVDSQRRRSATATALAGAPPIAGARRRPAGVARSARAACGPGLAKITFGTGGMLDLCTGADAARDRAARRARARSRSSPGAAAATLTWGVEAIMLSAGTNVEWLRDDLGHHRRPRPRATTSPPQCADTDGVVYVPALLGLGTPTWDYGARGTLLGLTRGSGPAADRAGRARGRRPARRRPGRGRRGRHRPHDRRRCGSTAA